MWEWLTWMPFWVAPLMWAIQCFQGVRNRIESTVTQFLWFVPRSTPASSKQAASKPQMSETDRYCAAPWTSWARTLFSANDVGEWNVNVNPVFYDRAQLTRVWEDPKNALETEWRRRILMTSTPQGNVIMFYDAYKEGFAYYSDQTSIPYRILNTVALKYVKQYRCRDFFVDETLLSSMPPDHAVPTRMRTNPSKMIQHKRDEEKKEQDKKKQTMQSLLTRPGQGQGGAVLKFDVNSPFIKPKPKAQVPSDSTDLRSSASPTTAKATEVPDVTLSYTKNRFLYLGKIHNWTPLQLGVPKPKLPVLPPSSTTKYDALFSKEMLAQKNVMDYQTYKKALQTSQIAR